jgi:RimJ/RimL family protein N-acetyltransferase
MIETERLILRLWIEADREPFVAFASDPEVSAWLGGEKTPEEASADFDRMRTFWAERGHGWLAIARKSDDAMIGRVVCRRQPPEWNHPLAEVVEIGWGLARDAWGHGYASEAAAAILPWGFETLATPVIYSWTARSNRRSEAVMQRIGMTRRADLDFEHPDLAADHPLRSHVVYEIER